MSNKSRIDRGHVRTGNVRQDAKVTLESQIAANPAENDLVDATDADAASDPQIELLAGAPRTYGWVQIGANEARLSDFTPLAQQASGMTAQEWNAATPEARDSWIDSLIANEQKLADQGEPTNVQTQPIVSTAAPTGTAAATTAALEPAVSARGQTPSFQHIDEAAFGAPATPTPTPAAVAAAPAAPQTPPAPTGVSTMAKSLFEVVLTYITAVPPRTPVEPQTLIQQQVYLYRAITAMINRLEGEEFTRAWTWLLACFDAHRGGVFGERHVFRAMEEVTLSSDDRKAFQRLLNLLVLTCEARSRPYALKQIDMTKTLALGLTEPGRQRVHAFYGV